MDKCNGMYNCYPNCDECPRYQNDCDGCEEQWDKENSEDRS